jgi:hypothetical protein
MKSMQALEKRIVSRTARKKTTVFLRKDFEDLADYDQVGRSLRKLVARGKLVKIGYGLYAKAAVSPLSGTVMPTAGFRELAQQALRLLEVAVVPSSYERAYNEGRTPGTYRASDRGEEPCRTENRL